MTALFASPLKTILKNKIEARAKAAGVEPQKVAVKEVSGEAKMEGAVGELGEVEMGRKESRRESGNMGPLGLPNDPEGDFEEIVREVREEIEGRQRKGFGRTRTSPMPRTPQL